MTPPNTLSERATRGRISSLQVMRGVAAGSVVIAHSIEHAPGAAVNAVILTGR